MNADKVKVGKLGRVLYSLVAALLMFIAGWVAGSETTRKYVAKPVVTPIATNSESPCNMVSTGDNSPNVSGNGSSVVIDGVKK